MSNCIFYTPPNEKNMNNYRILISTNNSLVPAWLDDEQIFNNDEINTYYFYVEPISSSNINFGILHLTSGKKADIVIFDIYNSKIDIKLSFPNGTKIELNTSNTYASYYYEYKFFKFLNYDLFKNLNYTKGKESFINITYSYPYKICVSKDKYIPMYFPADIISCYKGEGTFVNVTVHIEGFVYKTYANLNSIPLPWKELPRVTNITTSCSQDYSTCNYTWKILNSYNHKIKCYLVSSGDKFNHDYILNENGNIYYVQTPIEVNCSMKSFICDTTKNCNNNFPMFFVVRDMELLEPISNIKVINNPDIISEE